MGRSIDIVFRSAAGFMIAALLYVAPLTTFSAPAPARTHPCPSLDAACLDYAYEDACTTSRGSSVEKCLAWNAELRAAYGEPGSTAAVGVALALSYSRLAQLAGSEDVARAHQEQVGRISYEVVAAHPDSSAAYIWLALLEYRQLERRAEWWRRAVAVDGSGRQVEQLIAALHGLDTVEGYREAVEVAEAHYDRMPAGPARWERAATVWNAHTRAGSRYPELAGNGRGIFEQRVRADSEWDEAARIATSLSADALALRDAFRTVCSPLKQIFDDQPCIRGLETAMQAARAGEPADAQAFADTVAEGIVIFRPVRPNFLPAFSWADTFGEWLDELLGLGLDSVRFYEARLQVGGGGRYGILNARLAILEREPENADAWFQVGKAHFDIRQWEQAHAHLETARRLSRDRQQGYLVEYYLRSATYEIDAAR